MGTKYFEKEDLKSMGMAGDWEKTTSADGKTRTYELTSDGGVADINFLSGGVQSHGAMKTGSKIIKHSNGNVEVEEIT